MNNKSDDLAICVKDLTKIYRASHRLPAKTALDALNLSVKKGSFFGLLGSNGAGKSTLINILASTVTKTSGSAAIMGFDIEKSTMLAKTHIGVVPQEIVVDSFFTLEQSLEFTAGYYGIRPKYRRTIEIIKALGLLDKKNYYPRQLSGGMKRRFLVAKAMVHSPAVLILDEPTAGVDIELREQLWDYIKKLNSNGCTIIITTHYLEEAQELCNQIAFMSKGKIIKEDSKENLLSIGTKFIEVEFYQPLSITVLESLKKIEFNLITPNKIRGTITAYHTYNKVLSIINLLNLPIKDIQITKMELGDIFKKIMN